MQDNNNTEPARPNRKVIWAVYAVTIVAFLFYIVFSDHAYKKHQELNRKIANLEKKIVNTQHQVSNDYTYEQLVSDSVLLEKYAREQLNMHKADEDVFILIYE
ncbi:MAG: septum formation initiator family protein [Bacteroidales bacterium]|nr:septum formation initiator family protein [Bacteroidales bacterium]